MVTSISVAPACSISPHGVVLSPPNSSSSTIRTRLFCGERAEKAIYRGRKDQQPNRSWEQTAHLPEHPQKPVIDCAEDSCHGDSPLYTFRVCAQVLSICRCVSIARTRNRGREINRGVRSTSRSNHRVGSECNVNGPSKSQRKAALVSTVRSG